MSLTIKRKKDNRVVKCVLHRVADIPGGVTVNVANLGGDALFEGTPLAKGSNGLYEVVKTAQLVTDATAAATTYDVAKGHHFKVGDYIGTESVGAQRITAIDKSDSAKDVITVGTTLGTAITAGACMIHTSQAAAKTPKFSAIAFAGSNEDVEASSNLFVSAWVIGVINEANAPIVSDKIKTALKGVVYV